MKFFTLLPVVALSTAFVVPDEQMASQMVVESQQSVKSFRERLPNKDDFTSSVEAAFDEAFSFTENALDAAISAATSGFQCYHSMTAFDIGGWLNSPAPEIGAEFLDDLVNSPENPDHDNPPYLEHPPHRRPSHGEPNLTVYELIAKSNYTTKLAKLINEYPDLVDLLNGTLANFTVFAPIDSAFERIPGRKPSKDLIKTILSYHVSSGFYPVGRLLVTQTIPTALGVPELGGYPQRLRVGFTLFKGLNINFYSKIVGANIFGTNGVIHGIDHILLPPPSAAKIIELLPGEFSTLVLGLQKTGLFNAIAEGPHEGGTLFAPDNGAFKRLGPRINAFLFSKFGEKYLKALLKYHIVANQTLYSDAYYEPKPDDELVDNLDFPKGRYHYDLPTLLDDKSLSVDIARFGGLVSITINGFSRVAIQDGIARDGVIHVVKTVLIPPKTHPDGVTDWWSGEELSVEEFKDRLDGFIARDGEL